MKKKRNMKFERENVDVLAKKLENYDVISFDIFDTLILRPFDKPEDMFRLLSPQYNMINFFDLRKKAQAEARKKMKRIYGHSEIKLEHIYRELNDKTGISIEEGIENEYALEKQLCYANPYMYKLYNILIKMGKQIIMVSDMYLPEEIITSILNECGYNGYKKLYVSCEYKATKLEGSLFEFVKKDFQGKKIIHIGDNLISDVSMPLKFSIDTYYYCKNSEINHEIDNFPMSKTIGSAYKGMIKNRIYNGIKPDLLSNKSYLYGYIYSGLFVLGYVNWIHRYAQRNSIDKILFLSRDGYLLNKVYNSLFNDIESEYVLWSRSATLMTSPERDVKRFIWQLITRPLEKSEKTITVKELLEKTGLQFLKEDLYIRNISLEDKINKKNRGTIVRLVQDNFSQIVQGNNRFKKAAEIYYGRAVHGFKNICIVDIGYRGSGAIALKNLFERDWGFKCNVDTVIAYGFSKKNSFDDTMVLDHSISTYVFSDALNVELSEEFQTENQLLNMSITDILLASAPEQSFLYFDFDKDGEIIARFDDRKDYDDNIYSIHRGICDFINEYRSHFDQCPMLFNIPGVDAHRPIQWLFSEKNLKKFVNDFSQYPYSSLVPGVDSINNACLKDSYEALQKANRNKNALKRRLIRVIKRFNKKVQRHKYFRSLRKCKSILKRLIKIRKNKVLRARTYFTKYYNNCSVNSNIVLLQSYNGVDFSGNPFYLYKTMNQMDSKKEKSYYIGVDKNACDKVKKILAYHGFTNIKLITIHSRKYCKILATAKYLINNRGFASYFIKKDEQIYVQTWHGTPLKGLGKDAKNAPEDSGNFQKNCFITDYFIMPNSYSLDKISSGFMLNDMFAGKYLVSGYPRNTIFLNNSERQRVRSELGLESKEIIVYMPTWRRSMINEDNEGSFKHIYNLLAALDEGAKGKQFVFVKFHSLLAQKIDFTLFENIRPFPAGYETYEFLNIADCLITDYSSVFFDFALTRKKIILFAYDKEEYLNSANMYFSMDSLPFPIAESVDNVIELINNYTVNDREIDQFLEQYCNLERKDLCDEICNYILKNEKTSFNIISKHNSEKNLILIYLGNLEKFKVLETLNGILDHIDSDKNKVVALFYKSKVRNNRLLINQFSNRCDYIVMSGAKDITFSEGIANVLYRKFGKKNQWIIKKMKDIYRREKKRCFGDLKFDKIIDLSADSLNNIYLYESLTDNDVTFLLPAIFYMPNKYKKIKEALDEVKYDKKMYLIDMNSESDIFLKPQQESLMKINFFENKQEKMSLNDVLKL